MHLEDYQVFLFHFVREVTYLSLVAVLTLTVLTFGQPLSSHPDPIFFIFVCVIMRPVVSLTEAGAMGHSLYAR